MTWRLMSEEEPDEGAEVVVQTKDRGPNVLGHVRRRHLHGSLECSYRPIPFSMVHRWLPVPAPPDDVPRTEYGDDIPF